MVWIRRWHATSSRSEQAHEQFRYDFPPAALRHGRHDSAPHSGRNAMPSDDHGREPGVRERERRRGLDAVASRITNESWKDDGLDVDDIRVGLAPEASVLPAVCGGMAGLAVPTSRRRRETAPAASAQRHSIKASRIAR